MTCLSCGVECKRFGKDRYGVQRFRCRQCNRTFLEPHYRQRPLGSMYTTLDTAVYVLNLLIEGMSVSAVERTIGIHHVTILSLIALAGQRCQRVLSSYIRNIPCQDVQCDEIWDSSRRKKRTSGRGKRTIRRLVTPTVSSPSSETPSSCSTTVLAVVASRTRTNSSRPCDGRRLRSDFKSQRMDSSRTSKRSRRIYVIVWTSPNSSKSTPPRMKGSAVILHQTL